MAEINHNVAHNPEALLLVLESILVDLTALDTAVDALASGMNVLTVKLNSDGGVSDTNYATDFAGAAALTTTS